MSQMIAGFLIGLVVGGVVGWIASAYFVGKGIEAYIQQGKSIDDVLEELE